VPRCFCNQRKRQCFEEKSVEVGVWMDFHFREGNANWLTNPAFDPISKTAEYKACAVRIAKL